MSTELIVNSSLPETRIALMESGEIQELLIERASGKGIVGNIYKGRITRVLPGMQAAFVDIGLEKAAFLYVDDVYVHSEIWEEEEGSRQNALAEVTEGEKTVAASSEEFTPSGNIADSEASEPQETKSEPSLEGGEVQEEGEDQVEAEREAQAGVEEGSSEYSNEEEEDDDDDSGDEDDEESDPQRMGPPPGGEDEDPPGTISPGTSTEESSSSQPREASGSVAPNEGNPRRRGHRRGRRGGKYRRPRGPANSQQQPREGQPPSQNTEAYPENYQQEMADRGSLESDRSEMGQASPSGAPSSSEGFVEGRPTSPPSESSDRKPSQPHDHRNDFRSQRSRDRRIRPKTAVRNVRTQVNIQDLVKEGQEVLVQVAKDPIATKGARLTCHISLPGRHLVCMPTIDHVGVSRRIERDDERRKLREYVERNRPKNLGFIVRTASGKTQSEKRIKQDIDYLTRLWTEIREKAASVTAPALVYEDLNSVLRAIRDWVNEDIDKIIVDSRYHYNDVQRFVSHFMPSLRQKVELYHGDIPIFDAYGISTELSRSLERKVWLKSGGYIVIDQAEALVAIDVNTGRYVGKKNLEDTILKTNLEAVQEIAYQLRLRNCGGIIILDLIDMEKEENKYRVYRALEDALKKDRARPTILKISELGLVEMTRKRTRDTIIRTLCENCMHCEGKGFIKSKQTVAYEVLREIEREGIEKDIGKVLVQAHPEVIDILAIDERETLDQLERRYRKQIYLQAVTDYHPEQFEVVGDKKERSHRQQEDQSRNERERSHPHREREPRERASRERITPVIAPNAGESGPTPVIRPVNEGNITPIEGNLAASSAGPQVLANVPEIIPRSTPSSGSEDSFEEEDRLAFLRAQAAQDAALAQLRNTGAHSSNRGGGGGGSRGGGRPGGGKGRRGGKFRRNDHRSRHFSSHREPRDYGGDRPAPVSAAPPSDGGSSGESGGGDPSSD